MGGSLHLLRFILLISFFALQGHALSGSRYAAMVVDGDTGKVLFAKNAHAKRQPASLTKKMTLYLIFEALKKGKITFSTSYKTSARATRQVPSWLGLKVGESIKVGDIIKGLITKSANDAAVVAAEGLAGSVEQFTAMMNNKAKSLGMNNTHFRNPSGVPDPRQLTTANDMILLGRALHRDFPEYYKLFKLKQFSYKGLHHRNHNHMLGAVEGLDGIKTGFICASGFNISTSVARENRRIFAVVMGGANRHERDRHAKDLIEVAFKMLLQKSEEPFTKPSKNNMAALELEANLIDVAATSDDEPKKQEQKNSKLKEKIRKDSDISAHIKEVAQKKPEPNDESEEDEAEDMIEYDQPAITGVTPKSQVTLIQKQTSLSPDSKKKVLPANWVVPQETVRVVKTTQKKAK